MGDVMAIAAFLKFSHNAGSMRCSMAVLAFGDCLVLFLMAEGARQGIVFGLAGAKHGKGILMAYATVL